MLLMAGMAAFGAISSLAGSIGAQNQKIDAVKAQWAASIADFNATKDAVLSMQAIATAETESAVGQTLSEGAAKNRQTKEAILVAGGKLGAQGEGITAGNSAARQAVAFRIQANKAVQASDRTTQSQVSSILKKREETENALMNQMQQAENKVRMGLATAIPEFDVLGALSGAIGGASAGANLGSSITSLITPAKPVATGAK